MRIQISYYALFREQAGGGGEVLETDDSDGAALFDALRRRYGFTMQRHQVRLAVNDVFVDWSRPLQDGDQVVFIPPVAGG